MLKYGLKNPKRLDLFSDITLGFLALGCFVVCFIIAGVTEIEFTSL